MLTVSPVLLWIPQAQTCVHPIYDYSLLNTSQVGLPRWLGGKESACQAEEWVSSQGGEDPLKKEMATHSGILAWEIPWTEELGGLQSTGSQGVRLDLVTKQQQQQHAL